MRVTMVLRAIHLVACAIGALAFGIAVLRWFLYRFPFESMPSVGDVFRLGGLIMGLVLGALLVWCALHPASNLTNTKMFLYAAWIGVFAWYWFNSFSLHELHSFDPEKIAREELQHTVISIGAFLVWTGLYLIGPILRGVEHLRQPRDLTTKTDGTGR